MKVDISGYICDVYIERGVFTLQTGDPGYILYVSYSKDGWILTDYKPEDILITNLSYGNILVTEFHLKYHTLKEVLDDIKKMLEPKPDPVYCPAIR